MIWYLDPRFHCGCHFWFKTHITTGATWWSRIAFCHCQQCGLTMALPKTMTFPTSHAFHANGFNMIWDLRYSCWVEPNVMNKNVLWGSINVKSLIKLTQTIHEQCQYSIPTHSPHIFLFYHLLHFILGHNHSYKGGNMIMRSHLVIPNESYIFNNSGILHERKLWWVPWGVSV
jgi:hypothetical protein